MSEEIVGTWQIDDGAIEYEAQVFETGCRLVVADMTAEDVPAIAIADGLVEINETIRILQEALALFSKLPAAQQGRPSEDEHGEEDSEEDDSEEDEEESEPDR